MLADSVIVAAEELLIGKGTLSVAGLARRAGVGVASIYDYFSDKAGVMDAVVDRLTARNFEVLAAELDAHAHLSPHELVDVITERVVETYLDPERSRLMTRVAILVIRRSDPKVHLEYLGKMAERLSRRAREAWPTLTVEEANAALAGVCDFTIGVVLMQLLRGTYDAQQTQAMLRRAAVAELDVLAAMHAQRSAS